MNVPQTGLATLKAAPIIDVEVCGLTHIDQPEAPVQATIRM
jgi:hypothetical protein